MEILNYLPVKQTAAEEMAYKRILERVEQLKIDLGDKYILAKENAVKRTGERNEML